MKTFLIVILTSLLAAAAVATRPDEEAFRRYAAKNRPLSDAATAAKEPIPADQIIKDCTFHDRLLWTEIHRNGQTIYAGAFSHWLALDSNPPPRQTADAARERGE